MTQATPARFHAFWAINGALDRDRLCRQLNALKAHGLDGVVFHPRFYPNEPRYLGDEYLRIVSEVILHAKAVGLAFWLYDENGWPSGTVGGQLLENYPADMQHWAGLYRERPERVLAEFEHEGRRWYLGDQICHHGVDYLNPDVARHFIEMTYERYRRGLAPEAWDHVEAIFSDEPEFGLGHAYDALPKDGAIPWTPRLPELWRERHGEELGPLVPLLFFPGEGAAALRVKFWELLTDLFNASFVCPIDAWCRAEGKRFTAHVKGEEHPLFQIPTSGSCHQFFRSLALPGIDALERFPANNFYPRQVSSAARQFGDGRCMVEAFGGSGWGGTPEDLERYLLWLGRNGLTDFVMHLSQYRLDSAAMHDWPPSQPLHLTWSGAYRAVLDAVRAELAAAPRPPADTLVVAPYRGIAADYCPEELPGTNVHNAAIYPDTAAGRTNTRFLADVEALHRAGVAYDIADERTVEETGEATEGGVRIGRCVYRRVRVDPAARLSPAAAALLRPWLIDPSMALEDADGGAGETGEVQPDAVVSGTRAAGGGDVISLRWRLVEAPHNALPLECEEVADGEFTAGFRAEALPAEAAPALRFADDVTTLRVNGHAVSLAQTEEGSRAELGGLLVPGVNRVRFRRPKAGPRPFVWFEGRVRVLSESRFLPGPGGAVKTEGPFVVVPPLAATDERPQAGDLVADGLPFLRATLRLEARVELPREARLLLFHAPDMDAARLSIDGDPVTAWSWPRRGELCFELARPLAPGPHILRLEVAANGYNAYGPHHYYGGDWHVVSPDQIRGARNFADPADAPERTHVSAWHFRPFAAPASLRID